MRAGDAAQYLQTMACITNPCSSHISHCVKQDVGPTASLVHHHTSTLGFTSAPCSISKALKQTAKQSPCKPDNNHCLVWYPLVHSRRCTTVHLCRPTSAPCSKHPVHRQAGHTRKHCCCTLITHSAPQLSITPTGLLAVTLQRLSCLVLGWVSH
jgi:hypothetical protein